MENDLGYLELWTVIFCFDEHIGFVDYFFIALLIEVGQSSMWISVSSLFFGHFHSICIVAKQGELTHSQYLQILMQQNIVTNVEPVIRKALNLTGKQVMKIEWEERRFGGIVLVIHSKWSSDYSAKSEYTESAKWFRREWERSFSFLIDFPKLNWFLSSIV